MLNYKSGFFLPENKTADSPKTPSVSVAKFKITLGFTHNGSILSWMMRNLLFSAICRSYFIACSAVMGKYTSLIAVEHVINTTGYTYGATYFERYARQFVRDLPRLHKIVVTVVRGLDIGVVNSLPYYSSMKIILA